MHKQFQCNGNRLSLQTKVPRFCWISFEWKIHSLQTKQNTRIEYRHENNQSNRVYYIENNFLFVFFLLLEKQKHKELSKHFDAGRGTMQQRKKLLIVFERRRMENVRECFWQNSCFHLANTTMTRERALNWAKIQNF